MSYSIKKDPNSNQPQNGDQNPYSNQSQINQSQFNQPQYDQPQNAYYNQPQYNQPQYSQPQNPYYDQPQNNTQNPYYDSYYDQMYTAQQAQMQTGLNLNGGYSDGGLTQGAALGFEALNTILGRAFLYMFIALLLTGITSVFVASSPALLTAIFATGRLGFIFIFALEFVIVIACTTAMNRDNVVLSAVLFAAYSIINGLTFSVIFLAFELTSIISVFFTTAAVFGIMAFLGAVTKRDLSKLGNILLAGLIGIIIASVINIFIGSTVADLVVTIIGVAVFLGFTAYDVNKIIKMSQSYTGLSSNTIALYGAMQLYLDFINLFLKLLRLFGKRK